MNIQLQYNLTAYATNTAGNSLSVNVVININNIAEVPVLEYFTASVDENAAIGTVVGSITITNAGDSAITSFTLSNTTNFEVDVNGVIKTKTVLDYETKDAYNLKVFATNTQGDSTQVDVDITITPVL